MVTATFRFYGELNEFLAPARRGVAFDCACARAATTKHMIEALGVPHTEVELLLVNGNSSDFDHLLAEGERVAVYPRFESLDVGSLLRVRPRALPSLRFVADAHLGGLARLLRMAGFDTLYDNHFQDDEIERLAFDDERIVLTRDRELLKRSSITHGCYVRALKPDQQLREMAERLDLAPWTAPFTLCMHCNAPLHRIDEALVQHLLPPTVRACQHEFRSCGVCHRVYWKGSHWKRMCEVLAASMAPAAGRVA